MASGKIKAIDKLSVHRITSSQVVVDLQTAIKELLENALDAGATNIEVRVKENGLKSVEVIDNGTGISAEDYDIVALKHHTSKLSSFEDLTTVDTFGFRGEALASLCALCESVSMITATAAETPMGTILEFDKTGRIVNKSGRVARQRGTTVILTGLFIPLPVRRKEFERHAKREYGKALTLLSAYALFPCTKEGLGVRLTVSHLSETGKKTIQIQTDGSSSLKKCVTALWGPKALDNIIPLDLDVEVEPDAATLRKRGLNERGRLTVKVNGLISKFALGCGRSTTDRQYFFINGRPCNLAKIQKSINEVYKTFNATQSPFVVLDFSLPKDACDINVSPDKRTIFVHSEHSLIEALKDALNERFDSSRSTFTVQNETKSNTPATASKRSSKRLDTTLSSPNIESSAPSSDPLPTTQPTSLITDDSDPLAEATFEPEASDHGQGDTIPPPEISAVEPNSSSLSRNMSPEPGPSTASGPVTYFPVRRVPLKRRASRSPNGRPANVRHNARSSENSVQMVLDTNGASWSLKKDLTENAPALSRTSRTSATKSLKSLKASLGQFRREGKSASQPIEVEEETEDDELKSDGDDLVVEESKKTGGKGSAVPLKPDVVQQQPSLPPSPTVPSDSEEDGVQITVGSRKSNGDPSPPDAQEDKDQYTMDIDPPQEPQHAEVTDLTIEDITDESPPEKEPTEELVKMDKPALVSARFDLQRISQLWVASSQYRVDTPVNIKKKRRSARLADEIEVDDPQRENAEEILDRVIQKSDFETMEILGQFNLGFIIVRSKRAPNQRGEAKGANGDRGKQEKAMDDLFIVDQHAADEKYNFETLQLTTHIECQKLLHPRPLDLSASDRLIALENLNILQLNGFEVKVQQSDLEGNEESSAEQLALVSQPVSKSTVFDMSDLSELLHLLGDQPAGTMVRCSKARAMFASRACRKSFMVGNPMTRAQMTSVIRHMGTMDQPWNCPHGRPTMRHLLRMTTTFSDPLTAPSAKRKVDWKNII